jgi:hypothetical protein
LNNNLEVINQIIINKSQQNEFEKTEFKIQCEEEKEKCIHQAIQLNKIEMKHKFKNKKNQLIQQYQREKEELKIQFEYDKRKIKIQCQI